MSFRLQYFSIVYIPQWHNHLLYPQKLQPLVHNEMI